MNCYENDMNWAYFQRLIFGCLLLCLGCNQFFYQPNRVLYAHPEEAGFPAEVVSYPSLNGKTLHALWLRTTQKPKGTIVHFHGNFANVTNHFPASLFLVKSGFDVLIFDYQGYGGSQGSPGPKESVEDGVASIRYASANRRNTEKGVGIFGQSLGGAVGIVAASQEPLAKVLVIEAAFASYKEELRFVLRQRLWTRPLVWPASWFTSDRYAPIRFIEQISPRPILFVHGTADEIVPYTMSEKLFRAAKEPKQLYTIPNAHHMECLRLGRDAYIQTVTRFFEKEL